MKHPVTCQGPVGLTRRNMLQIGAIGALHLSLPQLLAASERRARTGQSPRADSCILVFLNGGPSHLDLWDMKPAAPQNIRGEFRPIATAVPGIQVCEHLPRLARVLSHGTLVRSVHHDQVAHAPAVHLALTGVKCANPLTAGASPTDHPALGSVVGLVRPSAFRHLPYVLLPHLSSEFIGGSPQPGFLAGWLGRMHDPFLVLPDSRAAGELTMPALSPGIATTPERVQRRARLLETLNPAGTSGRATQEMGRLQTRACDLLTSPAAQRAFRLDREPDRLRDAYGRNIYGQSLLLARRLVEAGTRLVCVAWAPHATATWDTHGTIANQPPSFDVLKQRLLPPFDAGISSLLTDLADRGLLDRTLVVAMGEIGRSPRINAWAGRDHWEFCDTALLAGGGIRGGRTYGSSDPRGAYTRSRPVSATDLVATIYHALGISPDLELRDRLNRPVPVVPGGAPVAELFS